MLPFIKASVALPIPQPGQGIPVIILKKQTVWCWWLVKESVTIKAKYPPAIEKIVSRYFA